MRDINRIIIHCSATPEGRYVDAKEIDRWHRERGFSKIGYHYVVLLDGTIQFGRRVEEIGAHVKGFNRDSIGICYIGGLSSNGVPKDTRTSEQKVALKYMIQTLLNVFPGAEIFGHRDFDKGKECPCFDAHAEYSQVA